MKVNEYICDGLSWDAVYFPNDSAWIGNRVFVPRRFEGIGPKSFFRLCRRCDDGGVGMVTAITGNGPGNTAGSVTVDSRRRRICSGRSVSLANGCGSEKIKT